MWLCYTGDLQLLHTVSARIFPPYWNAHDIQQKFLAAQKMSFVLTNVAITPFISCMLWFWQRNPNLHWKQAYWCNPVQGLCLLLPYREEGETGLQPHGRATADIGLLRFRPPPEVASAHACPRSILHLPTPCLRIAGDRAFSWLLCPLYYPYTTSLTLPSIASRAITYHYPPITFLNLRVPFWMVHSTMYTVHVLMYTVSPNGQRPLGLPLRIFPWVCFHWNL